MSSILRTSKFARYIAGFARNININPPRDNDWQLNTNCYCICGSFQRSLSAQAAAHRSQTSPSTTVTESLEQTLRRLDRDARRSGRISRRDIEDALEEIRSGRGASSSQSLLVIRCCGNLVPDEPPEVRTRLVQEIWSTLLKLNIPMDISHYNALLRVYLENEHKFSPVEFLEELESKGIEPNRVTFQRLIAYYCQQGNIEGATQILEAMKEKKIPVNESVFNSLIMGHYQAGDMESAKGILSVMTQAGLTPSADTYTTLLCGLARRGNLEELEATLKECTERDVHILDKDYLDIVFALACGGYQDHIPVILEKVQKSFGYNQDAINVALRLISRGHEDIAWTVLQTVTSDGRRESSGADMLNFFVRHLVKAGRSVESIIQYCRSQGEEKVISALLAASDASLQLPRPELAFQLLDELKTAGYEVRQRSFWPLLDYYGKAGKERELLGTLSKMVSMGVIPAHDTLRAHAVPYLTGSGAPPERCINALCGAGVSVGAAASATVFHRLNTGDLASAAAVVERVPAYYSPIALQRPASTALSKTRDIVAYSKLLRYMYEYLDRWDPKARTIEDDESKEQTDENNISIRRAEMVGSFIQDVANVMRGNFPELAPGLLQGLVNQGLSITGRDAELIQNKLGEALTDELSSLLDRLSSGELSPTPLQPERPVYVPSSQMNANQLERLIHNLQTKGENTKGLKRQLLTLYCRAKDLPKMEALLQEIKSEDFVPTEGLYAQLLDVYCHHNQIQEATECLDQMRELNADFVLDDSKIMRYAETLLRNNKFEECIDFLDKQASRRKKGAAGFSYSALCWRVLNQLAEQGEPDQVKKLFETLVRHEYIEVTNVLLGPLIKAHLVKNDLDKAMEMFEWCCTNYRATPWKNELACRLIQQEDAAKLQKLTDLSTSIHGEVNSLYDLVFAFVECGRVRQARKILETPGLQTRPQRINSACERYRQEGMLEPLRGLMEATRDLNHIDRADIFYQLLLSYRKQGDADSALGLWTQMQEEDVQPTDSFLIKLAEFLKEQGRPVPFVVPQVSRQQPSRVLNRPKPDIPAKKSEVTALRQAIKDGDVARALELKNLAQPHMSPQDYSHLVELLVKMDQVATATDIADEALRKKIQLMPRIFKFLLNRLANAGDVDTVQRLGSRLDSDAKKTVSFDNRLCHAYEAAGRAREYLQSLEASLDEATAKKDQERITALAEAFPRGGVVGVLEKEPELVPMYEQLALKFLQHGIASPLNVLWAHFFVKSDPQAERLWNDHLKNTPRIMFQRIVQMARDQQDASLVERLIEHLRHSHVSEGAVGNAYSCLLDILYTNGRHADLVQVFETALQQVSLDVINRTAIVRVKDAHDKLGKPFPHRIPDKNEKKQSSSSSSSGEEEARANSAKTAAT